MWFCRWQQVAECVLDTSRYLYAGLTFENGMFVAYSLELALWDLAEAILKHNAVYWRRSTMLVRWVTFR
jgi:hypothetical protein